jgi:hypothetical protein
MLLSSQGHEQNICVFKDVQRFAMHRDAMIIHDPSSTERQLVVSAARYFHSYPGRKYPQETANYLLVGWSMYPKEGLRVLPTFNDVHTGYSYSVCQTHWSFQVQLCQSGN